MTLFNRSSRQRPRPDNDLRKKLRIIIFQSDTPMGKAFDIALLCCIVASILLVTAESMPSMPLQGKEIFTILEYVFTFFFTLEYLCRLYCSRQPRRYALSFFGIIDLLSTLPLYVGWIFGPARYLMIVRVFRLFRVFRVFRLFSFLQEGDMLMRSIMLSAPKIGVFFLFAVIMAISMGTFMFMVEGTVEGTPFTDIPTSIYWAVVTMTTVGYGDIAPATHLGRILSAIIMLMGYTIIAVPTGIVSAQMVHDHTQRSKKKNNKTCRNCGSPMPQDAKFCPSCGIKQENENGRLAKMTVLLCFLLTGVTPCARAQDALLTGTVIGTRQSVDYSNGQASTTVNTAANAFDGNLSTFFASYERSRTWCGLDLGEKHVITRIGFSPRNDSYGPKRMVLGLFEGANDPSFMDAVPLYIIDKPGNIGEMTYTDCPVTRGFRYVRYVGPADARCNVAEIAFWGHSGEGDDSRFYQLTNLPTLSFHTTDAIDPYDKEHNLTSHITIVYDGGARIQEEAGTTRLRGNASMAHPKKPYRIKFDNSRHIFKNSEQRSPAKAKKWTLINNHDDKTLMRNLVAFEIARRMGFDYVPWSKPVDVIVNGEYRGCYQLTDQLTIDKKRIDITEMEPHDNEGDALTGGYLLELDGYAHQETSWFTSAAGNPITIKSPDRDDITPEQAQYIRRDFSIMETKILARNFADPTLGYRSKLDGKSLMQYFLTEELAGNPDAFWSCYMTKERGNERYRIGPVWDFDNAFDNDYRHFPINDVGNFLSLAYGGAGNSRALLKRIFADQTFRAGMAEMWDNVRKNNGLTAKELTDYIDSTAIELQQSQRLNFIRWPILDKLIQVNPRAGGSYEVEVGWIKEYIENRIPWLDRFILTGKSNAKDSIEIASAQELMDFAERVNGGEVELNARLLQDIDATGYPSLIIGTAGYKGHFDGNGHTVTLAQQRNVDYAGLFHSLSGAQVSDLTVSGTINTNKKYAGGIAGQTEQTTISRCRSRVKIVSAVNGDGTHGGLVGIANTGSLVEDCLIETSLTGSQTSCCGGVVGWASGMTRIRRCLVNNNHTVQTTGCDLLSRNASNVQADNNFSYGTWMAGNDCGTGCLTAEQLTSGEACFKLEGSQPGSTCWRQTLLTDNSPVPSANGDIVYCRSRVHCNGTPYASTLFFTNNASQNRQDAHNYSDGTCTACGMTDLNALPRDERGFYLIGNAQSLKLFGEMIEQGYADLSAVLTADIDMSSQPSMILAEGKAYCGTFDGAGHTITLAQERAGNYAGLFAHLSGTVQDLTLRGSVTCKGKFAGMVGELLGGTLLRCQSYIDIQATAHGDGTHGGLAGLVSEGSDIAQMQDCIFAGSISGKQTNSCGGLVGWASTACLITNCLMAGSFTCDSEGCNMICRNSSNAILINTYYLSNWDVPVPSDAICTNAYNMAQGALCYQLNMGGTDGKQAWYQTLDNDAHPVPDCRHETVWLHEGMYTNEAPDAILAPLAQTTATGIYDISGRRLSKTPHRGVYIVNNKKYVK